MEITITEALQQVKSLQKRLDKERDNLRVIAVKHGESLTGSDSYIKPEDFSKRANSNYQSVVDLMNRIVKIKKAIVKSNQTTMITIGGRTMSVQDAIIEKDYLGNKEELLDSLRRDLSSARTSYKMAERKNEETRDKLVNADISSNKASATDRDFVVKATEKAIDYIKKSFEISFVDPLKVEQKVDELDKEIDEFKSRIDYTLSQSNSTHTIKIDED